MGTWQGSEYAYQLGLGNKLKVNWNTSRLFSITLGSDWMMLDENNNSIFFESNVELRNPQQTSYSGSTKYKVKRTFSLFTDGILRESCDRNIFWGYPAMETLFEGIWKCVYVCESVCMCVCVHLRICVRERMGCFCGGSFFWKGKILIKTISHEHLMKLMKIQRLSDKRNVKEIVWREYHRQRGFFSGTVCLLLGGFRS